jgi:hypothetical protein
MDRRVNPVHRKVIEVVAVFAAAKASDGEYFAE